MDVRYSLSILVLSMPLIAAAVIASTLWYVLWYKAKASSQED